MQHINLTKNTQQNVQILNQIQIPLISQMGKMQIDQEIKKEQKVLKFSPIFNAFVIGVVLLIIIAVLIINGIIFYPLYYMGVQIISVVQDKIVSKFFIVLMDLMSLVCNTPIIGLIFFLQMGVVKHKFKAIIHLSFFMIGFYFIAVFKQAYQQSRPIWTSNAINRYEWFCPTDFGNPSGHSYVSFPMFEPLIAKYIDHTKLKVFAWVVMLIFAVVVPFSRMYLGVHSLNQIFFGLSFGMAWIVLYRYGLRSLFYQSFSRVYKQKKLKHLILVILIHIITTIIPIIIFRIQLDNPLNQHDLNNLNTNCQSSLSSFDMQQSMFLIVVLQSVAFGFYYAVYALPVSTQQMSYFTGTWKYRTYSTLTLHCLTLIVFTGIAPAIAFLIIPLFLHQPYSKFIILNLSITIGGFLYIWGVPKPTDKYNWIVYNTDDQGLMNHGQIIIKTQKMHPLALNHHDLDTKVNSQQDDFIK